MELLTQVYMMKENNPEGVVTEQRVIDKNDTTQVASGAFLWKRIWDKAILEEFGQDDKEL